VPLNVQHQSIYLFPDIKITIIRGDQDNVHIMQAFWAMGEERQKTATDMNPILKKITVKEKENIKRRTLTNNSLSHLKFKMK
jgi:hypothetical protein